MSKKLPLGSRIRYRFDNLLAAGTVAIILSLAGATFLLVAAAATVISLLRIDIGRDASFIEAFWVSLLRTMDPGTMGGDEGWGFRIVALMVTLGGIFIVSVLIGLLTTGISQKLEELRKGRTFVAEQGHTLILGWSSKLFALISELVIANENQPPSCIVVMAPNDKVVMEDEIRVRLGRPRRTRIVCRTGDPSDPNDLEIVNPLETKSIIVLSPEHEAPDAQVIKSVLALMHQAPELEGIQVVAEFVDSRNALSIRSATGDKLRTVTSSEVIGRITAQVCRQSGLSAVYQELLDFGGDEIYFREEPALVGKTFGQALKAYDDASTLGIRHPDGTIELAPPSQAKIADGDSIIAIAEDDDKFTLGAILDGSSPVPDAGGRTAGPESILIIGWNFLGPMVLRQLDAHVAAGSRLHVLYDPLLVGDNDVANASCSRLALTTTEADTTERSSLASALRTGDFEHVVILCYRNGLTAAESDARTLMTLLQVRQLLESGTGRAASIVTELLDVRDVELAMVAHPDDFVVSERLTSLLLAQLAENPELQSVFDDLFNAGGATIDLLPGTDYISGRATFGEAVDVAMKRGQIAIGYRKADVGDPTAAVIINPKKSDPLTFSDEDRLIVLVREANGG